ncbi:MAG: hypothetical protein ACLTXL_15120 [Clostridia bacterium]
MIAGNADSSTARDSPCLQMLNEEEISRYRQETAVVAYKHQRPAMVLA